MAEYIGYRDPIGNGQCNMGLTDTEIIRCRDCKKSLENGWKCAYWVTSYWDEWQEADVVELADVMPDGFCFRAERRDT